MNTRPAVLGGPPSFAEGLPLARPRVEGVDQVLARIGRSLESGQLTNGPLVRTLEEAVASYLHVEHVVAVSSCTSGLMLCLQAMAVTGPVVMPSFTFSATAHAAHWVGARPRFADIDRSTLTLRPDDVAGRLDGASAIVATHLFGTPCDPELDDVARQAGCPILFDAAHALGSRIHGRPVGGAGAAQVFSCSPTKMVIAGEGGLVATNDAAIADHCRIGRDYGNPGSYDCRFPGLNARMSELHAAVALSSLDGIDDRVARRTELAERLRNALVDVEGLRFPTIPETTTSTFKDLTVVVEPNCELSAADLALSLSAEGVETRHYYRPAVHRQQAYAHLDPVVLPVTEEIEPLVLTLPLSTDMDDEVMDRLADAIRNILGHAPAITAAAMGAPVAS